GGPRAAGELQAAGVALPSGPHPLTPAQRERLALVPRIKEFGRSLGLSASDHYETINPSWDHVVWNVSASEELAFRPVRWSFPIVGTVPYLGFFERTDAEAQARHLRAQGLDVHVRTAGAYSSLGWYA